MALHISAVVFLACFVKTSVQITNSSKVSSDKTYMVYLLQKPQSKGANVKDYDGWSCGGAIIHPLYILTSASCLADVQYAYVISGYRRYVSAQHLDTDECLKRKKKKIIAHCEMQTEDYKVEEYYNSTSWTIFDLATARVDTPFEFHDDSYLKYCSYKPTMIKVNYLKKYETPGTVAVALGWGHAQYFRGLNDNIDYNQELLHYTSTVIENKTKCAKVWQDRFNLKKSLTYLMLCTYGPGNVDDNGVPTNYVDLWKNYNDTYKAGSSVYYSWNRRNWNYLRQTQDPSKDQNEQDSNNPGDNDTNKDPNDKDPNNPDDNDTNKDQNDQDPNNPDDNDTNKDQNDQDPNNPDDNDTNKDPNDKNLNNPNEDPNNDQTEQDPNKDPNDKDLNNPEDKDPSNDQNDKDPNNPNEDPNNDQNEQDPNKDPNEKDPNNPEDKDPSNDQNDKEPNNPEDKDSNKDSYKEDDQTTTATSEVSTTTVKGPNKNDTKPNVTTVTTTKVSPTTKTYGKIDFGPGLGNGICQNDHGSPLVTWIGGHETVIGVASGFIVTSKMECKGPFLFSSTACANQLIRCTVAKKERRRTMGCDDFGAGYKIVEKEIPWNDHANVVQKPTAVNNADGAAYNYLDDLYEDPGKYGK